MKARLIYILMLIGIVFACETLPDPEIEYSPIYPLSGEWWVTYELDLGGTVDDHFGVGHVRLLTYNTAANTPDEMWINDGANFWDFVVKAPITAIGERSFGGDTLDNQSYESRVLVQNGRVIERPDGDSIYFEVKFDDDADWLQDPPEDSPYHNTYIVSGRRVKGFLDGSGNTSYEADYGD